VPLDPLLDEIRGAWSPAAALVSNAGPSNLDSLSCAAGWGLFVKDGLGSTVRNRRLEPALSYRGYNDHPPWTGAQGLTVFPHLRFAFCPIEKVGCSQWMVIMNKMLTDRVMDAPNFNYDVSLTTQVKYGAAAIESIFANDNATRAVFVREPLSRFASAFLDKCVRSWDKKHCQAWWKFQPKNRTMQVGNTSRPWKIVFRQAIEWAMEVDLRSYKSDTHFQLQSYHCELHRRVRSFTVVGLYGKGSYAKDAACLLESAGLSRFNMYGARENATDEERRQMFLPIFNPWKRNRATFRGGTKTDSEEEMILKKLFTPQAARALARQLRPDYETFGFPKEPAWVDYATGEWYDLPVPPRLRGSPGRRLSLEGDEDDEDDDDLVELARQTGYLEL